MCGFELRLHTANDMYLDPSTEMFIKFLQKAAGAFKEYQQSGQEAQLSKVINYYRQAYQSSGEKHGQFTTIIINYSATLTKYEQTFGGVDRLPEVIKLLSEARRVMEKKSPLPKNYPVLLNNLGQVFLNQYRKTKQNGELQSAIDAFEVVRSPDGAAPGSSPYALSLIGSATALWTACELQPHADDVSRLNKAIEHLQDAREQNLDLELECYRHLGSVYDLLHRRSGNAKDLDASIDYNQRALNLFRTNSPDNLNIAPTLFNLAKQQFERHISTKNPEDLENAEENIDEVEKLLAEGHRTDDLSKQVKDLASRINMYSKRGESYASMESGSGEGGAPSRKETMFSINEEHLIV